MLESLHIQNYRCFREFRAEGFGRVNLLVGTNNCGKTSILESLLILVSEGDLSLLSEQMLARGENESGRRLTELQISHVFHGHVCSIGTNFRISATTNGTQRWVSYSVVEEEQAKELFEQEEDEAYRTSLVLSVEGSPTPVVRPMRISQQDGVELDMIRRFSRLPQRNRTQVESESVSYQYISPHSLSSRFIAENWNRIALTEEQKRVEDALRILEPGLVAIAFVGGDDERPSWRTASRGGVVVKFEDMERPVPIGSMGDGMWRMLVLAIAMVRCKDGVLLVDEIDTGLHHTVMSDMWRMIAKTAERLNVQVFATTHSLDCVRSIAAIVDPAAKPEGPPRVSIQRIERDKSRAVPYSEREIAIAVEQGIEVR